MTKHFSRKSLLFMMVVFATISTTSAQLLPYSFSSSNGTYTAITGGTVASSGATMDDATFSVSLPFSFTFNGTIYSQVFLSENGSLTFGSINPGSALRNAISSNVVLTGGGIAAPLASDLQGQSATSQLRYQTIGTAPNRIFVAQWTNMRDYLTSGQNYNFQARLSEGSNIITFSYGTVTNSGNSSNYQVGLWGETNAVYINRTTSTSWASTIAGNANTSTCAVSSTVAPTLGLSFIYTPVTRNVTFTDIANPFTTNPGIASAAQSFTLSGSNLGGNIVVTAPTGFEISSTSSTAGFSNTLTFSPNASFAVTTQTIFVRMSATATGNPSGFINITTLNFTANMSVSGSVLTPTPIITSFTPSSAKPGDAVNITGTNFNTTAANNIVFFGATRAAVTAATATQLTVAVPIGATYAPITVLNTATSLIGASNVSFNPVFSPIKASITTTDFLPKQDFTSGGVPRSLAIGDLDADGKPDLAVVNELSSTVSIFRNTSSSGTIGASSFATKQDFTTGNSPYSIAIGDLDGDGKPDLAVANYNSNTVSIFRNSSTTIGTISFAAKVDFATGSSPISVAIGDLDGDGKLDLAVANYGSDNISILKNTATSGAISAGSFAARVDFLTGIGANSVAIGDLDGDDKLDLAVANINTDNVSVLRNTSTIGSITSGSFATRVNFSTRVAPYSVAIGDLDGDGKPDLAVSISGSGEVSVFRNTATSGSFTTGSFATRVDYNTGDAPQSLAIGDLDGDGKLDLAVANYASNNVSVLRNTATSGSINSGSFAVKVDFATGSNPTSIAIGDLDGDGKPDVAVSNGFGSAISVLRNANTITTWNGSTWSNGTPVEGVDAAIASNNSPSSFTSSALTINSGVALNTTGITATVNGNITNNGNGITGTGTVAINANSTISGNSVTIPNNATLNLLTGTLTTGGLLNIAPSGNITGNYANISGTVTLQQSIIGQRGWRIFAHPFTTTQTFSSLASTNGITINTNNGAAGIADVRTFSNATNQWTNAGNSTTANTAYGLFIRGLASEVTGLNYTGGPTPFTYSVSGTLNGNSLNYQAASTSNTFIVGNPYAAPVTTAALTNGTGKPYFTYQIIQGATQQDRRTRAGAWIVASGNSSTTATIPILGVLAYQPTTTSSYTVSTSDINTSGTVATNLFRTINTSKPLEQLELNISSNGTLQDRWLLRYNQAAKNEGKDMNDLKKLRNDIINFYSVLNNKEELAVDARTSIARVPLGITAPIGTYNITVGENTLPGGEQLYLHDKLLNSYTQLQPNASYQFSVTADSNSRGNNRFELVTQKKATINNATNNNKLQVMVLNNIVTQQQATIQVLGNKGAVSIQMVDAAGNVLQTITGIQSGIQRINVTPKSKGMYWLRSSDGTTNVTSKLIVQ